MKALNTGSLGSQLLRQALASPTEPLNQAAVALQLGASPVTVAKWVNGRSRSSTDRMMEIEWLFKIEPEAWFAPAKGKGGNDGRGPMRVTAAPTADAMKEVA